MQELIYIHGFNSSAQSQKARETAAWLARHQPAVRLHAPTLPNDPESALLLLEKTVKTCHHAPGLIGSSMGGFFATILSERHALPAVLINPAVHPHRLLRHYLGPNQNPYTGVRYVLTEAHIGQLRDMEVSAIRHPERLWVLLKQGDETLDYRLAVSWYAGCAVEVAAGGNHAFEDYASRLPEIYAFLQARIE